MRATALAAGLLATAALTRANPPGPSDPGAASTAFVVAEGAPVVKEARYRMSAAIRPLLVFWVRSRNVGGARILWREDGDGRRGYELLIGSDPRRAPRKINRWGWEREDLGPEGAVLHGLMRKTDEESLEEAESELSREGEGGYAYKAIRSRVVDATVRSENTTLRSAQDYTYRDLAELQALFGSSSAAPRVRQASIPPGTWPGLLFAVADLIERAVDAALEPRPARRLLSGVTTTFTFNATLYDLRLRSTQWLDSAAYGKQRYERLVRLNLEHHNRDKKTRERFVVVCATDGPLARVPVFIEYQPKWWFKAQGVLDDEEAFP